MRFYLIVRSDIQAQHDVRIAKSLKNAAKRSKNNLGELIALLDANNMEKWLVEVDKIRKMPTTVKIYQCGDLVVEQSFPAR